MKAWVVLLFAISTASARIPDTGCLFDCGPPGSAPVAGSIAIAPGSRYDPVKGYGWEIPPSSAFSRPPNKITDSVTVDGVAAGSSIRLRVDLPPGRYLVTIILGGADDRFRGARVNVNGMTIRECVTTPWFRLPYHSVSAVVTLGTAPLRISLVPNNSGIQVDKERVISLSTIERAPPEVSLNAVDVKRIEPYPVISFSTALEPDSAAVASVLSSLERAAAASGRIWPLQQYLRAWSLYVGGNALRMRRGTGFPYITRLWQAVDALQPVIADTSHPLFDRALFLLGKIHYWLDKEEHEEHLRSVASQSFDYLRSRYPDNIHLRMYLGEKIDQRPVTETYPKSVPEWALNERRAMQLLLETIHWWVGHQTADGEMGGGFGDDVEMLREWFPAVLGADDEKTRQGFARLADGVWESGLLNHGYLAQAQDVEHSAEFVSDTQPAMMLVRYGDPEYVERGFLTVKNMRDRWTGVNAHGHRHFRSSFFGADSVLTTGPFAVDHTMNARAAKHALWLTWYTHDSTAVKLLSDWGRSWVDDANRTDNAKPSGIIPPAVSFIDDRVGGKSSLWYDPHLGYDYYTWDSFNGVGQMYDFLSGLHSITGDHTFVEPLQKTVAIANLSTVAQDTVPDSSLPWVVRVLNDADSSGHGPRSGFVATVERANDAMPMQDFRRYLSRHEGAYGHYIRTGDLQPLIKACGEVIERLRHNVDMRTSEVRFTDRVDMPQVQSLYSMYTGSYGRGNEFPSPAISWEHTGTDVAILVGPCSDSSISFRAFSFTSPRSITARTWALVPGTYEVIVGGPHQQRNVTSEFVVDERGERISFAVPARSEFFALVRLLKRSGVRLFPRPDIALSRLQFDERAGQASVLVHNIGNRTAHNVCVELLDGNTVLGVDSIESIGTPVDLTPQHVSLKFPLSGVHSISSLSCRATMHEPEICTSNNVLVMDGKHSPPESEKP